MSEHVGRISENWADEARTSALEARRRSHPDWHWGPTKAESKLGIVHVKPSPHFRHPLRPDDPQVADFESFTSDGRFANVRLHLDDDHPAVQDAQGDFPDMHSDHFEFVDTIPVRNVDAHGKNVAELGRQHVNEVTARIQAQQRTEMAKQNKIRREAAAREQTAATRAAREARRRELNAGLRIPHF